MILFGRNQKVFLIALALFVLAPVFASDQVSWVKDFKSALKQGAKENKFVVLDISASW
jgi:hypothetical protein